jgi:hypothetical protein
MWVLVLVPVFERRAQFALSNLILINTLIRSTRLTSSFVFVNHVGCALAYFNNVRSFRDAGPSWDD